MGEKNDAILRYLEDNARFADLMNGAVFGGIQAIDPGQLEDASEHYTEKEGEGAEHTLSWSYQRYCPSGQKRREHSAAGSTGSAGDGGLRNAASLHEL